MSLQQAASPQHPILCVLSLDGGGIRGYLTARILVEIERYLDTQTRDPKPLGKRFGLIVGTSTGGLIALALAIGKTAEEICEFYETAGPEIFSKPVIFDKEKTFRWETFFWRAKTRLFRPKFHSEVLRALLKEKLFSDRKLSDIKADDPQVAVTSVALDTGMLRKHASNYLPLHAGRESETLVNIALATTAAPTYFAVAKEMKHSTDLVDGGLVANNPAMIALIDACKILARNDGSAKLEREYAADVKMISVGTGQVKPLPYYCSRGVDSLLSDISKIRDGGGLLHWAKPIPEVFISCQSALVEFQMSFFLPRENYLRINPQIHPIGLEDVDRMNELKNYSNLTQEQEKKLRALFPAS